MGNKSARGRRSAADGNEAAGVPTKRLSEAEFVSGLELVGQTLSSAEETRAVFAEMDADGSGTVKFVEFCAWCAERHVAAECLELDGGGRAAGAHVLSEGEVEQQEANTLTSKIDEQPAVPPIQDAIKLRLVLLRRNVVVVNM